MSVMWVGYGILDVLATEFLDGDPLKSQFNPIEMENIR